MSENELIILLPQDNAIINPVTGIQRLDEQTVNHQGRWRIHKSDPDNIFPSDPHADRQDEPEKLNLYTGEVYDKNKKLVRTLSKKSMLFIYHKILKNGEPNIIQKLTTNIAQITYLPVG